MALPTKYDVKILRSQSTDQSNHRFEVCSASRKDVVYVVTLKGEKWSCSCPVWIFHRKSCKHIHQVIREIA